MADIVNPRRRDAEQCAGLLCSVDHTAPWFFKLTLRFCRIPVCDQWLVGDRLEFVMTPSDSG